MQRIIIYSHDTFGLGNMRRMTAIAEYLVEQNPGLNILMLSGSNALPAFNLPAGIDYIKLPCLARDTQGKYSAKSLDIDLDVLVSLRANLILNAVLDFEPELILVDKKPFGVNGELEPVLNVLTRRTSAPRLVLVLRDILDSPAATTSTWQKMNYHAAIADYYTSVLVLGDPQIFDMCEEYNFPASTRTILSYCGYIQKSIRDSRCNTVVKRRSEKPLVIVTPGGGQDGGFLLNAYLESLSAGHPAPRCSAVFCGPDLDKNTEASLRSVAEAKNVAWHTFSPDLTSHMQNADVLVTMAGYNTITEGLFLSKPMVVIPRVTPTHEQRIRAERLARQGAIRYIHPRDLTPTVLTDCIEDALTHGMPMNPFELDFNGLLSVNETLRNIA